MILPFDELNLLEEKYNMPFLLGIDRETVENDIYDLLIASFIYGVQGVNEMLGVNLETDALRGEKIIHRKVAGKTWRDRLNAYFDDAFADEYGEYYVFISGQSVPLSDAVMRIAETETTRVFNETIIEFAETAEDEDKTPKPPVPPIPGLPEIPNLPDEPEIDGQNRQGGRKAVKQWNSQEDDKVRFTHSVLDRTVVPLRDYFYTIYGDRAMAPGMFGNPAEDCNCRCFITVRWA